jgi:hypothetical protein
MPITVGLFYLTHPVNFPVGGKRSTRETHNFQQSVDFCSFHIYEGWVRVALTSFSLRLERAASEVKGKCAYELDESLSGLESIGLPELDQSLSVLRK